jgi:hypothetical protein
LQADQLVRERSYPIVITAAQRGHPHVAAIVQPECPTRVRKRLRERSDATLLLGIIFVARHDR